MNGVDLFHEIRGEGEPLVLVHGSWTDHTAWQAVLPRLAADHRVLVYDRRGHSLSERPPGRGTRVQDEDDLAALVEMIGAPVHVAASSFGASVALGLAARRPELFLSLAAHEPPLNAVVAGDDPGLDRVMREAQARVDGVLADVRAGDEEGGARRFVEEIVFGPGAWERMPDAVRATFTANAPTASDEQDDPDWDRVDLAALAGYTGPLLLTRGTESAPWFAAIADRLARALGRERAVVLDGEGHVPHLSGPARYAEGLAAFVASATRSR
ncbi:alpha/beta fold hydrolase [Streptomyces sp. NPDC090112]|uniref:alpha/beta fold hydrolase n=1 Tax=Streptomyces sp. NPDC090112 TaxID=3365949 RepID=UPI0037F88795